MSRFFSGKPLRQQVLLSALLTMMPMVIAWFLLIITAEKRMTLPLVLMALTPCLGIWFARIVSRSISATAEKSASQLAGVLEGDLTQRIRFEDEDEFNELAARVNIVLDNFLQTMKQFAGSSYLLSRTAFGLNEQSQGTTDEVKQASAQINMIAAASEQMAGTFANIARNCTAAVESADGATKVARSGELIIDDTVTAMNRVSDTVKPQRKLWKDWVDDRNRLAR